MAAKNDSTGPQSAARGYIPGRTLGRSGYVEEAGDRLHRKANHLDALLTLMSGADDESGMFAFNSEIQRSLLCLAGDLAHEVNEAQEETMCERVARIVS